MGLDRLKQKISELERLYDNSLMTDEKLRILKLIKDYNREYLEILGEAPTVQAFRKIMEERSVQRS